jgi:uncharacterized protein (DUF2141 family)
MTNILTAHLAHAACLAFLYTPGQQPSAPPANQIHVQIDGLRNDKGQLMCALITSDMWPSKKDRSVAHSKSDIQQGQAVCDFSGVTPGTLAVSVFHDENSNGKLDRNLLGMPKEGVGVSNNAAGHFGPPKFEDMAFHYQGGRLDLKITVRYL